MSLDSVAIQGGIAPHVLEVPSGHGRLRSASPSPRRQQDRPHGAVREISEADAWPRFAPLARRAWTTHLRERLRPGVEALGRTPEDDPQRVPADALAEGSADPD